MDDDLIGQLLAKGLDLNQAYGNSGTVPFTWLIGNAQNQLVNKLLTSAEQNQTPEQRLVWINSIDSMQREEILEDDSTSLCFELFSSHNYVAENTVGQTPLQLAIAKGYTDKSGGGQALDVSNLQIAEKLLRLGADAQINYQEPTRGNTALHIAYARRDYDAIQLLQNKGASQNIRNKDGYLPVDMLSLSFNQVKKLMAFHTSPDGHADTFRLEQSEFDNTENLQRIDDGIKLDRQCLEVNGKEIKISVNPFNVNKIEIAALEGKLDEACSLVNNGSNPKKAMESIKHRIDLLKFMIDDAQLHLQTMPWLDYVIQRQAIDNRYNGAANPYMYDIDETGYYSFQKYVEENRNEAIASTQQSVHGQSTRLKQFEDGLVLLEEIALKEAAKQADTQYVAQGVARGIDTQRITLSLQQELAALRFKKTLGSLALPLYTGDITWDAYSKQMEQAYKTAGGASNHYLPSRKYQLDKETYGDIKKELSSHEELDEARKTVEKDKRDIDDKILKWQRALTLISPAVFAPVVHDVEPGSPEQDSETPTTAETAIQQAEEDFKTARDQFQANSALVDLSDDEPEIDLYFSSVSPEDIFKPVKQIQSTLQTFVEKMDKAIVVIVGLRDDVKDDALNERLQAHITSTVECAKATNQALVRKLNVLIRVFEDSCELPPPNNNIQGVINDHIGQLTVHTVRFIDAIRSLFTKPYSHPIDQAQLLEDREEDKRLFNEALLCYKEAFKGVVDALANVPSQPRTTSEHFFDWLRQVFNQLDQMISWAMSAKYTMAESYTPGASLRGTDRRHFINPSAQTKLKEDINRFRFFEKEIDALKPSVDSTPKKRN